MTNNIPTIVFDHVLTTAAHGSLEPEMGFPRKEKKQKSHSNYQIKLPKKNINFLQSMDKKKKKHELTKGTGQ